MRTRYEDLGMVKNNKLTIEKKKDTNNIYNYNNEIQSITLSSIVKIIFVGKKKCWYLILEVKIWCTQLLFLGIKIYVSHL